MNGDCLDTKKAKDGSLLILILYVDDMLLAGSSMDEMATLQSKLNDTFDMKDLGNANHILGVLCVIDESGCYTCLRQSTLIKYLNISIWKGGRQ